MGSQTGEVDYYTFLFPLEYVSFQVNDLLEKEVMAPLKSGKMMIKPQIGDRLSDICDGLIALEYSNLVPFGAKKDTEFSENQNENMNDLAIQLEIKSILLQFFKRIVKHGFIVENNTSGRNTTEEMISIYSRILQEKFHLRNLENSSTYVKNIFRYFKEHFHITLSQYINHLRLEHARQLLQRQLFQLRRLQCRAVMRM